jgi:hypothetical protein
MPVQAKPQTLKTLLPMMRQFHEAKKDGRLQTAAENIAKIIVASKVQG